MPAVQVFVYGTLKPGYRYYPHYCAGRVRGERPAQVRGCLFDLPLGYPGLTVGDQWVKGYLLDFDETSILERLDQLEDYQPHRPAADNLYNRVRTDIFDRQAQLLGQAWVYRMALETVRHLGGTWIPSGEWHP